LNRFTTKYSSDRALGMANESPMVKTDHWVKESMMLM
jgi:hypothetical protein